MNKKGFTLIELLAAITILGMLMVITIPAVENLMARNRTKKYKAYAEAIERAAKLYMDSYGENAMVDNSNYFCIKLTYDTLKDRKLLKDFQGDESCENDNTFVYVEKNTNTADGKGYKYDRSVRCTKNNKEVYREDVEGRTGSCTKVDSMGGIQVSATGFDKWYQTINAPDITITIKDLNTGQGTGFGANTSIRYQWVKNGSSPDKTKWLTLDMGNATQTSSLSKKINRSTGNYPSGVEGTGEWNLYIYGICDTVGHCSKTQKFGLYKFDNIAPSCEVDTVLGSGDFSPTYSGSDSWNKAGSAYTNGKWTYRNVKTSIGSRSDTVNKSVQSDLTSSTVDRITVKQKVKDQNRNWQNTVTLKDRVIGNSYEVSSSGITTVTYYLKDNVGLEGSCTKTINVDKERPAKPGIHMYKKSDKNDLTDPNKPPSTGYGGGWINGWVFTTCDATQTTHEYSGTTYYADANGDTTDHDQKNNRYRNVNYQGRSKVLYKACTAAGLCSGQVTSTNIDLDRTDPTCSLSKSDNKSTSGISATFSRHDTQPYSTNTTLSGLDSSKTDAAQKYENLKTGGDNSKTYTYKATDHAGNSCSKSVKVIRYEENTTCRTYKTCQNSCCESYSCNCDTCYTCYIENNNGSACDKECWYNSGGQLVVKGGKLYSCNIGDVQITHIKTKNEHKCNCDTCYKTCTNKCCGCKVWNTVTKYKYD